MVIGVIIAILLLISVELNSKLNLESPNNVQIISTKLYCGDVVEQIAVLRDLGTMWLLDLGKCIF